LCHAIKETVMNSIRSLTACVLAMSLFGCQAQKPPPPDHDLRPNKPVRVSDREMNAAMVHGYAMTHIDAAVIREQMLYPYHFVVNGASLNELGQRDMDLLARHYMNNPGHLGLRRGEESKDTYDARVQAVLDSLKVAGVRMDRVKITDGMPGGDGISSDRVVLILEKMKQASESAGATDTTGDTGTGSLQDYGASTGAGMTTGGR
jgi:hypothetical protein